MTDQGVAPQSVGALPAGGVAVLAERPAAAEVPEQRRGEAPVPAVERPETGPAGLASGPASEVLTADLLELLDECCARFDVDRAEALVRAVQIWALVEEAWAAGDRVAVVEGGPGPGLGLSEITRVEAS